MLIKKELSILVFIDVQERLMPFIYQGNGVVSQCQRIAKISRLLDIPVIGVEQMPEHLGPTISTLSTHYHKVIRKQYFNACLDGLIGELQGDGQQVVLAGCETHICIMQTAIGLIEAGFSVIVIIDAVGSRRALDKTASLDRMKQLGIVLVTVEMLAFEWIKSAKDPQFKMALNLIKEA